MSIKNRITALMVAGGLTIGSIFGLSACKNKNFEQPEDEKEKVEEVIPDANNTVQLKQEINALFNNMEEAVNNQNFQAVHNLKSKDFETEEERNYKANYYFNATNKTQVAQANDDGKISALMVHDGEEVKWFSLEPEDVEIPEEYPNLISNILQEYKSKCSQEGLIKIEKINDAYILTFDSSIVKIYYSNNKILKIEESQNFGKESVENIVSFEELDSKEFDKKYSEVENKIEELNAEQNANLNA